MTRDRKKKILIAMSGGVDSSVAAALLVAQGHDVTGAYMVNFDSKESGIWNIESRDRALNFDCWRADYRDAVRVAAKLGIKLLKLDFTEEYRDFVLDYMFKEYEKGRTPNPDVLCNKFVKFGSWLEKAREVGFDYLATGHYAKVGNQQPPLGPPLIKGGRGAKRPGGVELLTAKDSEKDQTYFLHQLSQEQLAHTLFPLGDYTKQEVRELAKKFELPTADKGESMGICFVGEVPMREFLQQKIKKTPGDIVTSDGTVVGKHDGLAFYTIGQRGGIPLSSRATMSSKARQGVEGSLSSQPLFVVGKNIDSNQLIVGFEDDPMLYTNTITLEDMHWIAGEPPELPLKCNVRLRHRQSLQEATIKILNLPDRQAGSKFQILFSQKQKAATPGQFAVLYKDNVCLGGGVIG